MVGHKRKRVLGRVGRAVDAAARDFAREAAQLENGGGREAAAERLVEQQVEVVALDKDRVVVETAMRLDVAVAGLVGEGLAGLPARLNYMSTNSDHRPEQTISLSDLLLRKKKR